MSADFITRTLCPACGFDEHEIICSYPFHDNRIWDFLDDYYKGRIPKEKVDFDYCIARCDRCRLLFQKYILCEADMYSLYEEWISADESLRKKELADISLFSSYSADLQTACGILEKKPHEIRMLEFGMGWGFFLNVARAFNFQAAGLELSEARVEYAEKKGLKVKRDIRAVEKESCDFVYSNQVFEHIPAPAAALKELARITRKNGLIHIKVPSGRGMETKLTAPGWQAQKDALHPLEHINCFNEHAFLILGETAGLMPVLPRASWKTSSVKKFIKSIVNYRKNCPVNSINVYFKKV